MPVTHVKFLNLTFHEVNFMKQASLQKLFPTDVKGKRKEE